ncbi:MAG: hypothetical protein K6A23_01160 [Butyrivibrio sp.]|nr:hypothetical protein [Butyrivibrio sp.]
MNNNEATIKKPVLPILNIAFVVIAIVLTIISSSLAYSFANLVLIIALSVLAILTSAAACYLTKDTNKKLFVDGLIWISVILTAVSLCCVIGGRVNLMGYVYFSDLESNNPVAIAAMNTAIAAWVFYILALIMDFILGFKKDKE